MTTVTLTALKAMTHSVENGGGTFDHEGRPATSGVAVTTTLLATIEGRCINPADIAEHLAPLTEGAYLGTWFDFENDRWEVSETAVFENREDAIELARMLDERYVYDIDADECVAVS